MREQTDIEKAEESPAATEASPDILPEASVGHLCGEVGVTGVISDMAMRNYLTRIFVHIEHFLRTFVREDSAEFGISIALFPASSKRIETQFYSGTASPTSLERLQELIEGLPLPKIKHRPFACVVYRRWNQPTATIEKLSAFPSLASQIAHQGLEKTLWESESLPSPREIAFAASISPPIEAFENSVGDEALEDSIGSNAELKENGVGEKRVPSSLRIVVKDWLKSLRDFFTNLPKQLRLNKEPDKYAEKTSTEDSTFESIETSVASLSDFEAQEKLLRRLAEMSEKSSLDQLRVVGEIPAAKASDRLALAIKHTELQNWELANQSLTEAIDMLPPLAVLYAYRAKLNRVSGKSAAALQDLNRAVELAPQQVAIRIDRAELYGELSAWDAMETDLQQAVKQVPDQPETLMRLAETKLKLEKYDEARSLLETLLSIDPNHGSAHNSLGWLLHEHVADAREEALFHLGEAIDILPQEISPRVYRCLIYLAENKLALADEECQAILQVDPDSAPAHGLRGRILQLEGEYQEAIESCTRALDAGFDTPLVLLARALSYASLEQYEAAMRDCQATLESEPDNRLAYYLLGQLHLNEGELDAAEEAFTKSAELGDRDWTEPREQLALIQRIRENPKAAVETHTALIDENPTQVSNYVNRALAYSEAGEFALAEQDFQTAISMEPENERIFYLRGHYWNHRQEYERSLCDFDRVLLLAGRDDAASYHRAAVLVSLRRKEEAIEQYSSLIEMHPEDPRAYSGRCYALAMCGDEEGAEADLQRACDLSPEESERLRLQAMIGRASYLVNNEDYDATESLAAEIIEQFPEEIIGFRIKGGVHWYREEYVEAIEEYSAALEIQNTNTLLSARGQVYGELGEYEAAQNDLDLAIEQSRKEGENLNLAYALNGRAMVLASQDRWDEAERDFEESILIAPSNPWVYYHRGIALYRREIFVDAKIVLSMALLLEEPMLPPRKRQRAQWLLEKLRKLSQD